MERAEYRTHFALEASHWWFRSKRRLAFRLLRRRLPKGAPLRLLDAGCGTGMNLERLGSFGTAFGCDLSDEALFFCRERGIARLARADVRRLPFRGGSFDLTTLFDVLYHKDIPDDEAVLAEVARTLRPGGLCLITDSALESLRSPHDEAHHGARRYDKKTLRAKLERAGFDVLHLTYFFGLTFPAVYFKRRCERRKANRRTGSASRSDLGPVPRPVNAVLSGLLGLEARLAARVCLPFGSSIVALARKPERTPRA